MTSRTGTEPDASAYIPWKLHPKQEEFVALDCREALFGGAAGGGKSVALLAAALKYVHIPGYSAIIFRRHYPDLFQDGALIPVSREWLVGTGATWNGEFKRWTFPSGATLSFGTLKHDNDTDKYQGPRFHFVGFDELTQHVEKHYKYLFSRIRRTNEGPSGEIPLRMRATANPGGRGHKWVKQRFFVEGPGKGRVFVPSKLADNPSLDADSYIENLMELDALSVKQLLDGDWEAASSGSHFNRDWFNLIDPADVPSGIVNWVRFWDLAATDDENGEKNPDWTSGGRVGLLDGRYYITNVKRARVGPADVEELCKDTVDEDGPSVAQRMEQEPGSAGKNVISYYARTVMCGYDFDGVRPTGSKAVRAKPFASAAKNGNVFMVRATWTTDVLDELEAFPFGDHDDAVDCISGAVNCLREMRAPKITASKTRTHFTPRVNWKNTF